MSASGASHLSLDRDGDQRQAEANGGNGNDFAAKRLVVHPGMPDAVRQRQPASGGGAGKSGLGAGHDGDEAS